MKHYLLIVYLFFFGLVKAQDYKRTQNWYFGDSAGLSFATDPPTVLTDGAMHAIEGCATISDTSGNLLFYTNGVTVWNKAHQIMENGTGLNGHISSTQSALIVPWPGNDSLYYIFTTDVVGQYKGLQYSLVNINDNNGFGEVISKNTLLHTPVCEKITATHHNNGKSIWLLSHEFASDTFVLFLINNNGINQCPILQKVGKKYGTSLSDVTAAQGAMKFSNDGRLIVSCLWSDLNFELYQFDNETGVISRPLLFPFFYPFYAEYSFNSKRLYIIDRGKNLFQFSLEHYSIDSIEKSKRIIKSFNKETIDAIQIGSDKRIYISAHDSAIISGLVKPDSTNDSSEVNISISPKKALYGLPNFITSYFLQPKIDIVYSASCISDSVTFQAKSINSINAHFWSIFNGSNVLSSTTTPSLNYVFPDTGNYTIRLISGTDTVFKGIYIESKLELGKDTTVCNQEEYKLILPPNHRCLSWQDGSDSLVYVVTNAGKYYVSAYNTRGCLVSDTITVTFTSLTAPVITKRNDTLFTDSSNYIYKWRYNGNVIGGNTHFIKIFQNGTYRVEITDTNGCTSTSGSFSVNGLSINVLDANEYFSIYPVPTSNKLFVEPKENIIIESLLLRDITGRVLKYSPTTELSVQGLAQGIYLLEITDHLKTKYLTKIIIH